VIVDLSVPITTGMPVYPGDPEVALAPALTVAEHGVNVLHVAMGSQSGTHVDAPYHIDDSLPRLDELPLERFAGPAVVVDARGSAPRAPIGPEPIRAALAHLLEPRPGPRLEALPGPVPKPLSGPLSGPSSGPVSESRPGGQWPDAAPILLIATGWARFWGQADYAAHPWLTPEAAAYIVHSGVRTVGVDALSVDPTPAENLPAHRVLCGAHAVIAENLGDLGPLLDAQAAGRSIEVFLLPLRLSGADGAPVRAVARIGS
jgi:arylformamidase